jgi:hypothetical protein
MYPSLKLKKQLLALILAVLPALFLGCLVLKFGVNVPFWDQWAIPRLFAKVADSQLSLPDLLVQHNESRMLFPSLIFLGLAYLTDWDTRYEMLFIFVLACVNSFNFYYLARQTIQGSATKLLLILALINLLIFSPVQHENWLWGFQIALFTPTVCLSTALLVLFSKLDIARKVVWGMVIATISTFSFANGLLCWGLLPVAALLSPAWRSLQKKISLIVLWGVGFLANITFYFYNYEKPGGHPSLLAAVQQPLKAFQYFCAFLGNHLCGGDPVIAVTVGFIQLGIFGCVLGLICRFWRDRTLRYQSAAWITIALYVLMSAAITTAGRVGFGIEQALSSRYTTFSVYFTVALVALVSILANYFSRPDAPQNLEQQDRSVKATLTPLANPLPSRQANSITIIVTMLATTCIVLHLIAGLSSFAAIQVIYRDRLYAKTCLAYAQFVQDDCTKSLFPSAEELRKQLQSSLKSGILISSHKKSPIIQASSNKLFYPDKYGWFDQIIPQPDEQFKAEGWAVIPKKRQPADVVLLTYRNTKGKDVIFTIARVNNAREDVVKVRNNPGYKLSGWDATFSRDKLPRRDLELRAWAYDVQIQKIYPLGNAHLLKR